MKDSLPAWALKNRDETCNIKAVVALLKRSAPQPKRLLEFFGGIGGVTKAVRKLYPKTPLETWDMDDRCVKLLSQVPEVEVVQGDSVTDCTPRKGDGVLMDFNVWTVLRAKSVYVELMNRVFRADPLWVQLADSSAGKIHMNYESYGMTSNNWNEYADKLREWVEEFGYELRGWEESHHNTTMLLFVKKNKAL